MTAEFRSLAGLLPQPLLLVTTDGVVAAVNGAAAVLLGRPEAELVHGPLSRYCQNDAQAVAALIRTGARSASPSPGRLTLVLADNRALACRCEGARYRPVATDAPALVLLRLIPQREAIAQFSQLNQRIAQLSREIARRRTTEAQLRESTERLEQADRRKNEFLSMLAHELRNPLAPLRIGIRLLQRQHGALPDVDRQTRMMARQTDHMIRLIDDLLDVARLTQGTIVLRQEPLVLADALEQALEMQRPALEARGLTLSVEPDADAPQVHGDLTRLVQVFANLLGNAAKFTDSGGRVTVRCWSEGAQAVVSVDDTGVGIPAALRPQVFDLFVQGERSLDRSQGGLGIGLTIVRSIVQRHGGSVQVRSAGRGCGSQFVVRLPLLLQSVGADAGTPAPDAQSTPAARVLRVLVVDDNVDAARALGDLVASWGHEVMCVHSGREAVSCLANFDAEAMLLDIGLPGMNGYELAELVRQRPQTNALLLVAVTGYGDAAARQRSAQSGYDHHLTKPVDPDALEQILAEHATRRIRPLPG